MEFKWWFEDNYLSVMLYYVWMNVIRWVRCINVLFYKLMGLCYGTLFLLFDKLMGLCYGTLFSMHDVMVYILLEISCVTCWECFALLKALGGIMCCVRFSVPRNPMVTLSPMWSSENWSSSLVWSSGRGLVRVLYPLACVKHWGGDKSFTLFRLVTRGKCYTLSPVLKQDFDDDKRNLRAIWKSIWRTRVFMFEVIL